MSNNNSTEIERKFLISGFPKVDFDEVGIVKTIYINIKYNSDGKILQEIRIRRWFESGKGYRPDALTFKSGGTLTRTEIETNLTDNSLFDCFNELGYNPIVKDYRGLYNNGYLIEFNLVDGGTDTAFYYAEVEFDSEEEANSYVWPFPEVFIEDVTNKPEYKMANYWKRTRR